MPDFNRGRNNCRVECYRRAVGSPLPYEGALKYLAASGSIMWPSVNCTPICVTCHH